jgi:hypothetical protein
VIVLENNQNDTSKKDLLFKTITDLHRILERATTFFKGFTDKGFLGKLMSGSRPADRFYEFDRQITAKLNELTLAVGLAQQQLSLKTFQVVSDIEALLFDIGGLEAVADDAAKLVEFAEKLGENCFHDIQILCEF